MVRQFPWILILFIVMGSWVSLFVMEIWSVVVSGEIGWSNMIVMVFWAVISWKNMRGGSWIVFVEMISVKSWLRTGIVVFARFSRAWKFLLCSSVKVGR